jgi:hypothetical protein
LVVVVGGLGLFGVDGGFGVLGADGGVGVFGGDGEDGGDGGDGEDGGDGGDGEYLLPRPAVNLGKVDRIPRLSQFVHADAPTVIIVNLAKLLHQHFLELPCLRPCIRRSSTGVIDWRQQ